MKSTHTTEQQKTGRFAPSPTGPLHFGSLIAAVASYLNVKKSHGKWLLRIEDLDQQRCKTCYSSEIILTLEKYGFQWDSEIIYQSTRTDIYQHALSTIEPHTFACSCSRKQLNDLASVGEYGYIYPGLCRNKPLNPSPKTFSTRVKTNSKLICFSDLCQGKFCQNIENEVGDFILKRSDGLFAYQLAVVVDDALQNVTHVVRGSDLFDNTPRQIFLQQLLGYTTPLYLHVPVAVTSDDKKLSKQNLSPALKTADLNVIIRNLMNTLKFLGQVTEPVENFSSIDDLWSWAVQNWDESRIPGTKKKYHEES